MKIEIAGYALNPNSIVGVGPVRCLTPANASGMLTGDPVYGFDLLTTSTVHTIPVAAKDNGPRTMQNHEVWSRSDDENRAAAEVERAKIVNVIFQ